MGALNFASVINFVKVIYILTTILMTDENATIVEKEPGCLLVPSKLFALKNEYDASHTSSQSCEGREEEYRYDPLLIVFYSLFIATLKIASMMISSMKVDGAKAFLKRL